MNILLVAQCSKRALQETRRVLDQFAERKGVRTWQTAITQQGLDTLRKLLRKTAKRNTAVACHWIKSGNRTELLWIVGKLSAFNESGTVPTNMTEQDILRTSHENHWHTAEVIALLAAIAGLFHDFGKANILFQKKLLINSRSHGEPYRHEWVSLRIFQAFVADLSDQQWLEKLSKVSPSDELHLLASLIKDSKELQSNPFQKLPPIARVVGWLIVSHHRLPKFHERPKEQNAKAPSLESINEWLDGKKINATWNSPQADYDDWRAKDFAQVWQFDEGTPLRSATWCAKAQRLAKRALEHRQFTAPNICWLEDRFSSHIARMVLMLADHCYSAGGTEVKWQDKNYNAYANTDAEGKRKQKLDEHNIGVAHNALLVAKSLPKLRLSLPAITRHKGFKQRSKNPQFSWQDKAYDLAVSLCASSKQFGFFGVNMASTGCGKTFANARIMYGLADEKLGCRFSVALGLRTLTLQTGDALQEKLHLDSDDLAVLIGSQSIRELHNLNKGKKQIDNDSAENNTKQKGSASAEPLFAEHQYIRYDGSLDDGRLSQWLKLSPKLHQLLSAPVLVSTIDHLMPATEGERGGKQIAPMLRLLTSDLVLDEPDDFDLADLPALSRLVNWAGMLGSRVLLSSATLPPALVQALFSAYVAGRRQFDKSCNTPGMPTQINCAWFDEFGVQHNVEVEDTDFLRRHTQFVTRRLQKLSGRTPLRLAKLLPVSSPSTKPKDVVQAMAISIHGAIHELHSYHHQDYDANNEQAKSQNVSKGKISRSTHNKKVSIGLVRMANINSMVAIAQQVLSLVPQENFRFHFCIYHSQHPLIVRSNMEKQLDQALTRYDTEALWKITEFNNAVENHEEQHQVFIVFATSVAEVGRDHCYDWAIAEPSSMRSIIQLAGRVQRHRQKAPDTANIFILQKNFKALTGAAIAYTKPGFESKDFTLGSHDLAVILSPEQYEKVSATPRISPRQNLDAFNNLVDLEHVHLQARLFGDNSIPLYAGLWWQHNPDWSAEIQRRTRFRESAPDEEFILYAEDDEDEPRFHSLSKAGELCLVDRTNFVRAEVPLADRIQPWGENDANALLEEIADIRNESLALSCLRFAGLRLRVMDSPGSKWQYSALFGVYGTYD